jgi:hypothetical protein
LFPASLAVAQDDAIRIGVITRYEQFDRSEPQVEDGSDLTSGVGQKLLVALLFR